MEHLNLKNFGYNLRYGYTDGFNAALTDSENEFSLPVRRWDSVMKLDPGKYLRIQDENDPLPEYEYANEKKEYYKVAYNWGYLHGNLTRNELKIGIAEEVFEKVLSDFANVLEINFLQISKERYLHGVTSLVPEKENGYRKELIYEFLMKPDEIKADGAALEAIHKLITEKKVQQAIDQSRTYFRAQKNLEAYSLSISLLSRLMGIRNSSKCDEISREEYLDGQAEILEELSVRIEKEMRIAI